MSDSIIICDTSIRHDSKGRYCLNDLHRAAVASGVSKDIRPNESMIIGDTRITVDPESLRGEFRPLPDPVTSAPASPSPGTSVSPGTGWPNNVPVLCGAGDGRCVGQEFPIFITGPAVHSNPWKPDPKDERTPIGPGDTVDSLPGAFSFDAPIFGVLPSMSTTIGRLASVRLFAIEHGLGSMRATSMHRRRTIFSQAMPPIEQQSSVHAHHMLIGRVFERFVGKLHRIGKEIVGFVFGHSCIVGGAGYGGHSWIPRVGDAKNFASIGTGN